RNYLDARVMSVHTVSSYLMSKAMPAPRILLVPDFFVSDQPITDEPKWKVQALLGLLYERMGAGLKTGVYIRSFPAFKKSYGAVFYRHLQDHYL
ncbi:hypothetical protein ACTHSL_13515, partial [Neisseria sp. P0008.S010]|uniref:hypothetical protein n=1 Tax=Neisseria sp. P0008.S010 TaxID=3436707 RepID=UPI003F7D0192